MSRVSVYNKDGFYVGDIRTDVVCEYLLNAYPAAGRCTFTMGIGHAKTTLKYLEIGNYILVRTENLPDWIGEIVIRSWNYGSVDITAMQSEYVLQKRNTPAVKYSGNAGSIFSQILTVTNAAEFNNKPIKPNRIFTGGTDRQETMGNNALSHVTAIADRSGNDFDIKHSFDDNGRLYLVGNWYEFKGQDTGEYFREGKNIEISNGVLVEDSRLMANYYQGRGDVSTAGSRLTANRFDAVSIARYGLNQGSEVFDGNSVLSTLEENTLNKLRAVSNPLNTFDITVDQSAFYILDVGNIANLDLNKSGFDNGGYGYHGKVRMLGLEYDSIVKTCRVIAEKYDTT